MRSRRQGGRGVAAGYPLLAGEVASPAWRALNVLAQAAEAYLTRTEADDAVRDRLRIELFDATTDAWLLLRPSVPQPADEPAPVPPPVDALEPDPALLAAARDWVLRRYPYDPTAYGHPEARDRHIERDARSTAMEAEPRHFWAAGVAEGRRLEADDHVEAECRVENEITHEIEQREAAEAVADKLTAAIGRHLGVDFGEHSNLNDPWGNALVALAEADGGKFVKGAHEDGVAEGRRLLDETAATAAAHAYELGIAEGRRQATEERTEAGCRRGRSCYACSLPIGADDDYAVVDVCGHMLCGKHQNDDHSCAADHG